MTGLRFRLDTKTEAGTARKAVAVDGVVYRLAPWKRSMCKGWFVKCDGDTVAAGHTRHEACRQAISHDTQRRAEAGQKQENMK